MTWREFAIFQITVDIEFDDPVADQLIGITSGLPHLARVIHAEPGLQTVLILALTCPEHAAVATGCSGSYFITLKQSNGISLSCEFYGCGQASVAAANNTNICIR